MKMYLDKKRTDAYLGTFDCKSASDMDELAGLRRMVTNLNKDLKKSGLTEQYYVKAQGRGPRLGRYNQSLPLPLALTCDAYIYKR